MAIFTVGKLKLNQKKGAVMPIRYNIYNFDYSYLIFNYII